MLAREQTITSYLDIIAARTAARTMARNLGFDAVDQVCVATTVGELARTAFLKAGKGNVATRGVERDGQMGIEVLVCYASSEPLPDIEQVFAPRGTSALPQPWARRFMDEFHVESEVGGATRILCYKWCD